MSAGSEDPRFGRHGDAGGDFGAEQISAVDPVDDATIVVAAAGQHAELSSDETRVIPAPAADDALAAVSDQTIVVPQPRPLVASDPATEVEHQVERHDADVNDHTVAVVADYTVVVAAADPALDDGTVVASELPADDGTVVASELSADDGTRVAPARRGDRRDRRGERHDSSGLDDVAPSEEPQLAKQRLRQVAGVGLDPQRPIAPAPGMLPWEVQPTGERGVSPGLPVTYGARANPGTQLQDGVDEVHRKLGPAPEAALVRVASGREQLPSLQRKDRHRRRLTLGIYAGVLVASVLGLWGVASIAFGW